MLVKLFTTKRSSTGDVDTNVSTGVDLLVKGFVPVDFD